MSPSAVDTPDLSGLIELSRDPHLDLKPIVLRVQTDLFLAAPIRDRAVLEAFKLLATGLIPTVDDETAAIVARKLGPCHDTPEPVLVSLAVRGGTVCDALLDAATQLPPSVVAAARNAGAAELSLAALAAREAAARPRPSDDEAKTAVVPGADRGSAPIIREETLCDAASDEDPAVAGWMEDRPRVPSLAELIKSARMDQIQAKSLLARDDLADAELAPLWLQADREKRAAIRDAVEATATLRPCPPAPRDLGAKLAELSTQRDVTGFVNALAGGIGLPEDFLAAAPDACSRYDLLTLALRAADLRDADAIYIFLTLNEPVARSVSRVFELADLYRSTSRAAARDLLGAILDVALPERTGQGEHRPYLAPDTARPRASTLTERALTHVIPTARMRQMG